MTIIKRTVIYLFFILPFVANFKLAAEQQDNVLPSSVVLSMPLQLTDKEKEWLANHPIIRVGVDHSFAPYERINDQGKHEGIAADFLQIIAEQLGIQFEIVADKPWYEIESMAKRGELDMLSAVNITPERAKYLNFSIPFSESPVIIVTNSSEDYIGSTPNLAGKTVAVERSYFVHQYLVNNYPDIKLQLVNTTAEALNLVATGKADAYLGGAAYTGYAIRRAGLLNLQFSGEARTRSDYRFGITHPYPELLSAINKVLRGVSIADRERIIDRWMKLTVETGVSHTIFDVLIVAIVSLILIFIGYHIFQLRRAKRVLQASENRLNMILDSMPIACIINDLSGNILYINQLHKDLFGYNEVDISTLSQWWDHAYSGMLPQSDMQSLKDDGSRIEGAVVFSGEHSLRCANNEIRHVIARTSIVNHEAGDLNISTFVDITKLKKAEEALQLSSRVFSDAREGILISDAKSIIVDINPAFTKITGYSRDEVIGRMPSMLSSGKQPPEFFKEMWQQIQANGAWQGEIWNRKKNGELFVELLSVSTLLDDNGKAVNYLGIFSDITQMKEQQRTLELMAHYDVLTNLPNRTLFSDRFGQEVAHSKRANTLLAICFLDLDNFKPVNDSHGHDIGDKLLIAVAERIQTNIREEDTVSRQGGDEFTLLLGGLESPDQCQHMIKRIQQALAKPYLIEDLPVRISASIGITLFPIDNADFDTLLRHADQAMYQAKLAGRNCYRFFNTEQDQKEIEKQGSLQEIERALLNDEFQLYYQPKVNMKTSEVFGVEALIRWFHPEKGLVPPLDFLPAIEGTALEIRVGSWVVNEALKQLAAWREQGMNLQVSINISSNHLLSPTFFTQLDQALFAHTNLGEYNFQLEILESSALGDIDAISEAVNTCQRGLKVSVALDDFGTGYSSLTHLRHLSANTVKIDQTFVRDLLDDPDDYTIIDGVIGLADSFGLTVVAEGVETDQHGLMLLLMGCEQAQGYGIARPMPAEQLSQWLQDYTPNQQWLTLAQQQYRPQQQQIKIFNLTAKYWFSKFEKVMTAEQQQIDDAAIATMLKIEQNDWASRVIDENLFAESWLTQLTQFNKEMHDLADDLLREYQKNGVDAAQVKFDQLTALFAKQQAHLALLETPA